METVSKKRIIIYVFIGVILSILGRLFTMNNPDIPLFLNFTGVIVASYFGGTVSGTIVSLVTVLFGIIYGAHINYGYVYSEASFIIPMIVTVIFVGGFARKYQAFNKVYNTFGTYALVATCRSIVMITVNSMFYKGYTGLLLCDVIMDYQDSINGPMILKYILPSMIATFIDTFFTLFILFLAIKICNFCKGKLKKQAELLVLLGLLLCGIAASPLEVQASSGDNFVKKVFSSEEGLLGGAANAMVQTRDGAIWVGTYGGVYKYNGKSFEMMRDMPLARSVECLYVDSSDNLWISSNGTGLVVRTPDNQIFSLTEEDGLPSNTIRAVTEAKNQIYYVGTVNEVAMVRFDGEALEVIGTIPDIIYAKRMTATSTGYVLATTSGGSVYLIRDGEVQDVFTREEKINSVWVESDHKLYFSGEKADLYTVSIEKGRFVVLERKRIIGLSCLKAVLVSSDGVMYMAGNDRVGYIDEKGYFTLIQTGDFNNSIEHIVEDYQGNIWFVSVRCGLLELSASVYSNLFDVCNVDRVGVNTVQKWNDYLYVGTDEGLIVLDEDNSSTVENYYTKLFSGRRIRSLGVDPENHLWVSTQTDGAYELVSEDQIYNYNVKDGLPDSRARFTLFLEDGRTMVSTYSGISYIDQHEITKSLVINQDMSPAYALCLLEVDENTVFAGTNGDGICVLKNDKPEKYITQKDGIPSGVILNIYKDRFGDGYFVLSGSGMCYMEEDYTITEFSEFPYYNNTDLFQTENGNVVVLSTAGIYIVNYNELMSFKAINAFHLDEKMGLPGSITSNARNYMTDGDVLYFAGSTGVYKLNCSDYYIKVNSYKVNLNSVSLDGEEKKVGMEESILVPAGTKKITFNLELYNYTTTDPYIRYFMGGMDTEPVSILASELQEIVYYGLPSGNHVFRIEVLNPNTNEVIKADNYTIIKSMETYETITFKIFYIAGVILVGITLVVWIAIIVIDLNARSQKIRYNEAISAMEKEKSDALEKSLEREEMANRSKSDFLANMSHEIRTPINAIIGMDTMILRESNQSDIKQYAQNIYGASTTLLSLINDILDFSKIESGKMELVLSEFNLGSLINDINVMMRPRAEAKQLQFNIEASPMIPVKLWGDEGRIKQVMINILSNAVKYTEKGYVSLKLDYSQVDDSNIALSVSVSDTGIGIKREDLGKLFSAFDRIEENRNKNIEGTGLGMSITKNLLAMMNSELKVDSVYGKGSDFSFTIVLPVKGEELLGNYEDYSSGNTEDTASAMEYLAPKASVLVVDDVEMNLIVVRSLLKHTEMNIDTADSGMRAIEMAKAKTYDMIFLDAMMPKMDGVETLKHIRSKSILNQKTPIIMLTANAIKGAKEEYLEKGFSDYLSKPINAKELDQMVLHYLPENLVLRPGDEGYEQEKASSGNGSVEQEEADPFIRFMTDLPQIDTEKGIEASGGKETYEAIVKNFFDTSSMRIQLLKDLFEKLDVENYTIQVHALKSSARLIGAIELSELALEMEMAGKEGNLDRIRQKTPTLLQWYEAVYEELSKYFGKAEEAADSKQEITPKKFLRRIGEIRELLEAFDQGSAKELFDDLKTSYRIPQEYQNGFDKLTGEFAEANRDGLLELIDQMIDS